jgi:hypothetical protein
LNGAVRSTKIERRTGRRKFAHRSSQVSCTTRTKFDHIEEEEDKQGITIVLLTGKRLIERKEETNIEKVLVLILN